MKSSDTYAQLELISTHSDQLLYYPPKSTKTFFQKVRAIAHRSGSLLVAYLSGNSDPRISQTIDRAGNAYFQVHDPVSGQQHCFDSEQELRVWLDQRYSM